MAKDVTATFCLRFAKNSSDVVVPLIEEKQILTPYVAQLKETEIYKMLELRKILRQINDESKSIKSWKDKIQNAIRSGNHEKYNELLNI